MINPAIIKVRLQEIDKNLEILVRLKKINEKKFITNPEIFKLAERCLETNIQAILDICHHIIADNNLTRPRDNKHALEIIANQKIIPSVFAKRIEPMVGLRNILVHEYIEIDPKQIYQHIQNLDDFRAFQKHIIKYLEESKT